jgi:hypothetical protein
MERMKTRAIWLLVIALFVANAAAVNAAPADALSVIVEGPVDDTLIAAARAAVHDTVRFLRGYGMTFSPKTRVVLFATKTRMAEALVRNWSMTPEDARDTVMRAGAVSFGNDAFINIQAAREWYRTSNVPPSGPMEQYLRLLVSHELIHVTQYMLSQRIGFYGFAHGWLVEGSAELLARMAMLGSPTAPSDPFLTITLASAWTPQLKKITLLELSDWRDFTSAAARYGAPNVYAVSRAATLRAARRKSGRTDVALIFHYFRLFATAPDTRDENFRRAFVVPHDVFDREFQKELRSQLGN